MPLSPAISEVSEVYAESDEVLLLTSDEPVVSSEELLLYPGSELVSEQTLWNDGH